MKYKLPRLSEHDSIIVFWILVCAFVAFMAGGCGTLRSVRESADQVRVTAKDVSVSVSNVPAFVAELKLATSEYRALAATYRGKTVDGGEAIWVRRLKQSVWWILGLLLLGCPSPLRQANRAVVVRAVRGLWEQIRNGTRGT